MFANHHVANLTAIIAPIKVCCGVHSVEKYENGCHNGGKRGLVGDVCGPPYQFV